MNIPPVGISREKEKESRGKECVKRKTEELWNSSSYIFCGRKREKRVATQHVVEGKLN